MQCLTKPDLLPWPHPPWGHFWGLCLIPAMTRSTAYSKLNVWTDVCPSRAACSAASLHMLAMSAPVSTTGEQRGFGSAPLGLERRGGKERPTSRWRGVTGSGAGRGGLVRARLYWTEAISYNRPTEPPLHIHSNLFQSFCLLHCFTTQL